MFYHYRQNNSGGVFRHNDNVDIHVIVEANSDVEADARAETLGLYFDGAGDCRCCGNRWHTAFDGDEVPSVYGEEIGGEVPRASANCVLHRANGDISYHYSS